MGEPEAQKVPLPFNWPPSRGPRPKAERTYLVPELEREDIEREPCECGRCGMHDAEREAIEKAMAGEVELEDTEGEEEAEGEEEEEFIPREPQPLEGTFCCNYDVATVASLTLHQAVRLLSFVRCFHTEHDRVIEEADDRWYDFEPGELQVMISYPLSKGVIVTIRPYTLRLEFDGEEPCDREPTMDPGYVLWTLAKEYERIYREHEEYGVWGHAMSDLVFEGLEIRDGKAMLLVGS